jgi:hypothetical protein
MKHCSQCAHVGMTLCDPAPDDEEDHGLYLCAWSAPMPPTWRYATREVMAAAGNDAENCPCYAEKTDA